MWIKFRAAVSTAVAIAVYNQKEASDRSDSSFIRSSMPENMLNDLLHDFIFSSCGRCVMPQRHQNLYSIFRGSKESTLGIQVVRPKIAAKGTHKCRSSCQQSPTAFGNGKYYNKKG